MSMAKLLDCAFIYFSNLKLRLGFFAELHRAKL